MEHDFSSAIPEQFFPQALARRCFLSPLAPALLAGSGDLPIAFEIQTFFIPFSGRLPAGFFMCWALAPAEAAAVQRPPPRAECWRLRLQLLLFPSPPCYTDSGKEVIF